MCALRAHIKLSVFENIFSRIEKVMTAFSIPEKMFLKTENLMCALRAHISKILIIIAAPFLYIVMLKIVF